MTLPTQAVLQELLDYNPLTGKLTWKERASHWFDEERICKGWNKKYANQPAFTAQDAKGYFVGAILNTNYRANRVIYKFMTGIDPDQVDHDNGIVTDDRWENLKEVDHYGNQQNMKKSKANKSGVTGVCFNTSKNKWQATIGVDGKSKVLGRFDNFEDAVACRKQGEEFYGYHPNHGR